ncbi:hypothetical protein BDV23DRAFT_149121 [Aspergillus alliaceus]|uniref:Uncharacterized protein n=1 Tax=Petromyces alliaceus TaxID=209559 RepID=A0A5N7CHP5_PETAA|nr:hypothetical protein BDV23DRAFT_149121 [Aspergillus alliaceus]
MLAGTSKFVLAALDGGHGSPPFSNHESWSSAQSDIAKIQITKDTHLIAPPSFEASNSHASTGNLVWSHVRLCSLGSHF